MAADWVNVIDLPELTETRHSSYTGPRSDLLALLPTVEGPVLDIGCSDGTFGEAIKRRDGATVWGIEPDPHLAETARKRLDNVIIDGATEALDRPQITTLQPQVVVMADVLEHLTDPWSVYDRVVEILSPGGYILVSLPNVAHWDTHLNLLRGHWPHRDRGIHDLGHLRFFGHRDVVELIARRDIELIRLERRYRLREGSVRGMTAAKALGRIWPGGFTFQFMALGRKA